MGGICITEGCQRPPHARGLCGACYMAARKARQRDSGLTCTVDGCGKPIYNLERGLCGTCNSRRLMYGDPTSRGTGRPDLGKPLAQRFWEKVNKAGPVPALAPDLGPCWMWTMGLRRGYGQFIVMRGKRGWPVGAHRMAWELTYGPVPGGLDLDHLCHTRDRSCPGGDTCPHRRCVNPAHLELVTNEENIRRGMWPSAVQARKTHCDRGHEFTPENTYHPPKRPHTRQCRKCIRIRGRKRAA